MGPATPETEAALTVSADGWFRQGQRALPCALGRGGLTTDKREGDGATPVGQWPLRRLFWRPDRLDTPPAVGQSGLLVTPIDPAMGWCDDPDHADYNRLVALPHPARHETLWRDDGLYDVVVVLGYNDAPPQPRRGSAIFLHCARPDPAAPHGLSPTAGCIALPRPDLLAVLAALPLAPTLAVLAPT
ncbi:L,D-transpeptidase family protein [uncultured Rhodospira sp.]|uniref:L,D-transpeptidase family protein n=1 Tax=uncultured Rhodospira sp. TaxID=1936189 RepID=UPI00263154F7|nr:L,D-transpeptidase family protein [uncultured Rhodospira sp.]